MDAVQIARFAAAGLLLAVSPARAFDFTVTPVFTDTYRWSINIGAQSAKINPPLHLTRGQSYSFDVETPSALHPFYIKTASGIGSGNAYNGGGLSANGVTAPTLVTFDVPDTAPDMLYYNCGNHSTMAGQIAISVFRDTFGD